MTIRPTTQPCPHTPLTARYETTDGNGDLIEAGPHELGGYAPLHDLYTLLAMEAATWRDLAAAPWHRVMTETGTPLPGEGYAENCVGYLRADFGCTADLDCEECTTPEKTTVISYLIEDCDLDCCN